MNLANDTKNQHYISQVEQRLNTANPNAEPKNQKIYSFSILDRENHSIIQKQECKIENNLCFDELFSFDIIDKKKRKNFEDYFGQYESGIESDTENLLIKIGSKNIDLKIDLKSEILNLFISKFINFIRNPFSVKKILNTFEYGLKFHPLNELFREDWEKIINNKTKHQEYLCKEFSISEQDYKKWLHIIFMFFSRFEDEETPSLLELLIKEIYENKNTQPSVCIFTYDDAFCLLSDRGYTIPIGDNSVTSFDFNLCSKAFIRYIFVNKNKLIEDVTKNICNNATNNYLNTENQIQVYHIKNDLEVLSAYNKNTIYQCHNNVYCATVDIKKILINDN